MKTAKLNDETQVLSINCEEIGEITMPLMMDCGEIYRSYVTSSKLDEDGEPISYTVEYETTDEWKQEVEDYNIEVKKEHDQESGQPTGYTASYKNVNLEDEELACDWDIFEVKDEAGEVIARSAEIK